MSLLRASHDYQSTMANPCYKLKTALLGHSSDVRALATFADGTIVSTSWDKTARIWKPTGNGKGYEYGSILTGHTNFVTSVCVINPSESNPRGLILTGSHDMTIRVYIPDQTEAINVIKAHRDSVCKLKAGKQEGIFLSSSWDKTAKVWNLGDLSKPRLELTAHTAAVWCITELPNGLYVTGSADKLVIVWTHDGCIQHTLTGHTDCVRDVVAVNQDEFLTCSNDTTVLHWNATLGVCLNTYNVHKDYIYSIAAFDDGSRIFTSGEYRTLKIWSYDGVIQTINLPAQSVWCTALLPDGDVVTGSSDGTVRIFTCEPERYADEEQQELFEKQVANIELNAEQEIGGIKVKDLPDAKALLQPGQRDGQTKIIKDEETVKAYSWSQATQKWIKIGDVMGTAGGSKGPVKQLYNGKEYDYVFSIDVADGVPPLKLPYNNDEDPWQVAQTFLEDNGLSQLFLDQVARFIIKNSVPSPVMKTDARYADPFTGGSRYIPQTTTDTGSQECTKPGTVKVSESSSSASYIPQTRYLRLEHANLKAILEKLQELNSKQKDCIKVSNDQLNCLIKLADDRISGQIKTEALNTLMILLNWSDDVLFPVLDITRLAVLCKDINELLCTDELLHIVKNHIRDDAFPSNQMLAFRLLANMFTQETGEKLCLKYKDEILKSLMNLRSLGNKNNQVAISTFMLNLTVALNKHNDSIGKTQCLNIILSILPRLVESEAVFRTLVALGTLLYTTTNGDNRDDLINTVKQSESALDILKTMSETKVSTNAPTKLATCSKQIISLII